MTIFNFNISAHKCQLSQHNATKKNAGFLLIESLITLLLLSLFATFFATYYGNAIMHQKRIINHIQALYIAHSCAHRIRSTKKIPTSPSPHNNFTIITTEEKISHPKNIKAYRVTVQEKTITYATTLAGFIV
ncbi:MAG: hypothetical protein WC707_00590 [Candidatus Babeliaceae bacterium]|jgi:Tfp pilus assembly protein PilV